MEILRYDSGIMSSNMFMIVENGHAVVIDPAKNTEPGESLCIDLLIATHEHYDHISGVNAWKEMYRVPLMCSEHCAERIIDSKKNQARHFDTFLAIQSYVKVESLPAIDTCYTCKADITFSGFVEFKWQDHVFKLIEIPGHSPGSIGIFLDEIYFFSGDSLLKDTNIELRFPGGSKEQWENVGLKIIRSIPKGTTIYPGHFESFIV